MMHRERLSSEETSAMPPPDLGAVLKQLMASSPSAATDRQLLERFARAQDQDAFSILVKRYAGLVMGVCRRVLPQAQDAEDIFQAVFLVLARRAGSVRWNESIGGWIYEVSRRLALKARAGALRRSTRETGGLHLMNHAHPKEETSTELCSALDEELSRLPEKLRTPLALVYLDGRAREQVALQLGYSERTLKRRLAQAKRLLRSRLEKRGLTLSGALLAVGLSSQAGDASVRASLLHGTVKGATAFSAGKGVEEISPRVLEFATRMVKGMAVGKMHVCVLVTVVLGLSSAGAGIWARQILRADDAQSSRAAQATGAIGNHTSTVSHTDKVGRVDRYGDPLPPGALARLGTVRFRHEGNARSVAYSPDGRIVAASSNGGQIFLWDAKSGKEMRRLSAYSPTNSFDVDINIDFSPDGKLLGTRGNDGALRLWDTRTWRQTHTLQLVPPRDAMGDIPARIRFSPDGRMAAVPVNPGQGPQSQFVSFVDAGSGKESFRLPAAYGLAIAFSPDGTRFALTGSQPSLEVWSVRSRKMLYAFKGHEENSVSQAVAFSPDGKILAHGERGFVVLLEADSGREIARLKAPMTDVNSLNFTPDGKMLLSAAADGNLRVWDVATMKERFHVKTHSYCGSATLSPDGKTIAAGTLETLQLWDLAGGKELFSPFEGHYGRINCVAFSPNGSCIVTGCKHSRETGLWDAATGRLLRKLKTGASGLAFSPSGRRLATAWPYEPGIRIWDTDSGALALTLEKDSIRFEHVAYSSDGPTIIAHTEWNPAANDQPAFQTWGAEKGQPIAGFNVPVGPREARWGFALASGGQTAALGITDSMRIWDVKLGKERYMVPVMPSCLAFLPDGKTIVATNRYGTRRLLDVESGRWCQTIPSEGETSYFMRVSPDGSLVATGETFGSAQTLDQLQSIRICELVSGKAVLGFKGDRSEVEALAFSPDGKTLASGLRNGTALLWSLVPDQLSENNVEKLWSALAGRDAAHAYRVQWRLAELAKVSVPFLQTRLRPVPIADAKEIRSLIADMGSPKSAVYETASRKLIDLGDQAEPLLRKALDDHPSPVLRARINACLAAPRMPGNEEVRSIRAISVLERIRSPEARTILETLAAGAPAAPETRLAKAALGRLAKR